MKTKVNEHGVKAEYYPTRPSGSPLFGIRRLYFLRSFSTMVPESYTQNAPFC